MEFTRASLPTQILKKLIRVESWPKKSFELPKYQVHRGYWMGGFQENTLHAFKAAAQKGSKMVEMDVQLSRDQIPVVFHDEDCSRFSSSNALVKNLTAKELKELVNAPTLEEVLIDKEVVPYFNIEIKTDSLVGTPLERKVADVIEKHQMQRKVLFSSFNPTSLWRISQYLPDVPRAYLIENSSTQKHLFHFAISAVTSVHLLHLDEHLISKEAMEEWNDQKVPIAAWTVNDESSAKNLLNLGCVSIISDHIFS